MTLPMRNLRSGWRRVTHDEDMVRGDIQQTVTVTFWWPDREETKPPVAPACSCCYLPELVHLLVEQRNTCASACKSKQPQSQSQQPQLHNLSIDSRNNNKCHNNEKKKPTKCNKQYRVVNENKYSICGLFRLTHAEIEIIDNQDDASRKKPRLLL